MTQRVESKPCDVKGCGERSTSYSSGHGRWCDKHSPLANFNPDLKGRREEMIKRIAYLIDYAWLGVPEEPSLRSLDCAEKILQEIERG